MDESSVVDESSVPPGRRKFSSRREFSAFVDESSVVHLPCFLVDESSVKLVDESSVVDESSDSHIDRYVLRNLKIALYVKLRICNSRSSGELINTEKLWPAPVLFLRQTS